MRPSPSGTKRDIRNRAKKITSNRGKKQTEIISEEPVDTEKIKAAIEATGYTYLGAESEPYKKKGFLFF